MPISRKRWPECPIERGLMVLGGRWKAMVLWHLFERPQRFTELRARMPRLADRTLTQVLRELSEDGLVEHAPPHWCLSERGRALRPALAALWDWGTYQAPQRETAAQTPEPSTQTPPARRRTRSAA